MECGFCSRCGLGGNLRTMPCIPNLENILREKILEFNEGE